ncbi:MAG: helix-turn-helix domain-containing protein [Rhizobiales bacterium]|nr:helix-turn-helix domain-containing protein [Hyphomicrobiales bacterium]
MTEISTKKGYAIGEMSRQTGVNIETIRYYERIKILPSPGRTAGGNRQYTYQQLKHLFFVKRCRELGFSLKEVRALLELVDCDRYTCSEVHKMTLGQLKAVKRKLVDLKNLEQTLENMISECDKGDVPNCPIIETLFTI